MNKVKSYLSILVAAILLCMSLPTDVFASEYDYTINGVGYNWSTSASTITLSENDDTLKILKAPSSAQRIEVTSQGGSEVTIIGITDTCENTWVSVTNNIKLNIENLNIMAPMDQAGLLLNNEDYTGTTGTMMLNVSGICNINGNKEGYGIRSSHDQKLVIEGDGTLNATGGNTGENEGNAGTGISMIGLEHSPNIGVGANLTIEDGVTVNATGGSSSSNNGGCGISISYGDMLIKGGTVNAKAGVSQGTSCSSDGIMVGFKGGLHPIGGNLTIEGGTVTAIGGDADHIVGGYGIDAFNELKIGGGIVTVSGGNSVDKSGGAAMVIYKYKINITGGTVTATGGHSVKNTGGTAFYTSNDNIDIKGGSVTAIGGSSDAGNGGIAIYANRDVNLTDSNALVTGGNGAINGAHAIYSQAGQVQVASGAAITAIGGDGATGMGGVGVRAAGYDSSTNKISGNTVTVSANAGDVFIRGGQGATAQRASIMGKDVYIATGNIASVVMEGSNPRSIKNVAGGDDVYLLNVSTDPPAAVVVQSNLSDTSGGSYIYRAAKKADGVACMWLPTGSQTVSAAGYCSKAVTLTTQGDLNNAVTINKIVIPDAPAGVTATGGDAKVTLNWMSVSGAVAYKIYQSTSYGSYGAEPTTVSGSAISFESSGLTNGTTYYFVIKAINSEGDSPASFEVIATPCTVPGVPKNVKAAGGNGQATVTFTPPTDNGGSPITGYVVTSSPGNITASGTGTTITVTGLTNGTAYTFAVRAVNAAGNSAASTVSNTVVPNQPSTGGSTTTSAPATKASAVEEINVDVKQGNTDGVISQITMQRTTDKDGKKTDTVTYQREKALETIKNLIQESKDTARIVIPDAKDEVSETKVNIMSASLDVLSKGDVNLQIDTEEAKIDLPKQSIQNIRKSFEDDLYFKLVPVKENDQKLAISKRALMMIGTANGSSESNTSVIGNPITIETNMPSMDAYITLPLTGIEIPTNPEKREAFLKQLSIYIEHSDGDKEVVQGEIVEYKKGVPGIRFHISKFSIFTLIKTDSVTKSSDCNIKKMVMPSKTVIRGKNITTSVANKVRNITIKAEVSDKAVWELYANKACTKIIAKHKMKLKTGVNKAYIKVTAEDGMIKIYKIIITRHKSSAAN